MRTGHRSAPLAGLVLLLAATAAEAEDISFKRKGEKEKELVERVAGAVIKAARTKPQKIAVISYKYERPKANRTELVIKAEYHGLVTKKRYNADINVIIDSTNPDAWEVVNIRYADTNPSPTGPNEKKIQQLIREFNK